MTLLSYDEEGLTKEWNFFSKFKTPNYMNQFGCDILTAFHIIENHIPISFRNTAYIKYITDILYILFMSKEDTLITFPRTLEKILII